MNFYSAYLRTLFWKPKVAIAAMYWWCTGRKVRARNRLRMVVEQSPYAYQMWIDTIERQPEVLAAAPAAMAGWHCRPHISIILHQGGIAEGEFARLIDSLGTQCFQDWELVIVAGRTSAPLRNGSVPRLTLAAGRTDNAATALTMGLEVASGEYILPLAPGATLPPTALFRYVEALQAAPDATVFFGDHDQIDARGVRSNSWFKPRWNAEMFLAQDYLSAACLIRSDAARRALPIKPALADAANYALLLAVTAQMDAQVVRVPHIQSHTRRALGPDNQAARLAAVNYHLGNQGGHVGSRGAGSRGATAQRGPYGTVAVAWPLPEDTPMVSIIVPTRDHAKLLRACITSVLTTTSYRNFEVLIVDNGSIEPETAAYLAQVVAHPRVRVLAYDRPYNFSAINNFAVRKAQGEYLCLLNNDTEVLDADWLTELMRQAVRPEVGAVGAKLFYGDGTIQHAGVVIGMGESAGHAHRFLRPDDPGYFLQPHIAHYASAVTAACLVVAKRKFEAVGGLDEDALHIAFNDVDFCLKLEQAGWRNVYAPGASLIHHESKSRGKDSSPQHIDRYMRELAVLQERWQTKTYEDPMHHPSLDRFSENYVLRL
jgi:GT2 family glycosyltransferase